jgi:hypothetical protein
MIALLPKHHGIEAQATKSSAAGARRLHKRYVDLCEQGHSYDFRNDWRDGLCTADFDKHDRHH